MCAQLIARLLLNLPFTGVVMRIAYRRLSRHREDLLRDTVDIVAYLQAGR